MHANLFSENWPLKRCGARGDNNVVVKEWDGIGTNERTKRKPMRARRGGGGFDCQIHGPNSLRRINLLQNAKWRLRRASEAEEYSSLTRSQMSKFGFVPVLSSAPPPTLLFLSRCRRRRLSHTFSLLHLLLQRRRRRRRRRTIRANL